MILVEVMSDLKGIDIEIKPQEVSVKDPVIEAQKLMESAPNNKDFNAPVLEALEVGDQTAVRSSLAKVLNLDPKTHKAVIDSIMQGMKGVGSGQGALRQDAQAAKQKKWGDLINSSIPLKTGRN